MATKKIMVLILFSLPIISNAQSKWGKEVWGAYMNSCVESAKETFSEEKATEYCACTGVKLEQRHPDANELTSITQDEIVEVATLCLEEIDKKTSTKTNSNTNTKTDGPKPPTPPGKSTTTKTDGLIGPTKWSKSGYDAFMETCVDSAKESLGGEEAAKKYCDCSASKLQVKYPDENKVTVTEAEINKIAEECLGL